MAAAYGVCQIGASTERGRLGRAGGAGRAGAVEMRVVFTDPGDRLAERAGHPGPWRVRMQIGSSASTAQADRAGPFSAFGGGLRCAFALGGCLRLLDTWFAALGWRFA